MVWCNSWNGVPSRGSGPIPPIIGCFRQSEPFDWTDTNIDPNHSLVRNHSIPSYIKDNRRDLIMSLRREVRLRKEFLLKKEHELKESQTASKKRQLMEALEEGKYLSR